MRRYTFSIRGLMIVILMIGVALVALRTPSRLWANLWFTLALGGVTLAIPAAVASIGERRAFWIGFAACGGVYFLFALAPWIDERTSYQLATTAILDLASPYIVKNQYMIESFKALSASPVPSPLGPTWQNWNLPDFRTNGNLSWTIGYVALHSPFLYFRIGHALFCLLAGIAGGEFARYLYLRHPTPPGQAVA